MSSDGREVLMKIDLLNCESWFLDYHEGRLDERQARILLDFLQCHPELRERFDEYVPADLDVDSEQLECYPFKDELRKYDTVTTENIDHWLIAEMEGDLRDAEKDGLISFLLNDPVLEAKRRMFQLTKLEPDPAETFEGKALLLRNAEVRRISIRTWMQYAAVLIVIAGTIAMLIRLFDLNSDHGYNRTGQTAEIRDVQAGSRQMTTVRVDSDKIKADQQPKAVPIESKRKQVGEEPMRTMIRVQSSVAAANSGIPDIAIASMPRDTAQHLNDSPGNPEPSGLALTDGRRVQNSHTVSDSSISTLPDRSHEFVHENSDSAFSVEKEIKTVEQLASIETADSYPVIHIVSPSTDQLPLGSRLALFAARSVERITGHRVRVRTFFNPLTGELAAYEITNGSRTRFRQYD